MAAVSGVAAGILGLTSWYGFLFYFVCSALMSLILLYKCNFNKSRSFFKDSKSLLTDGVIDNLMVILLIYYILFNQTKPNQQTKHKTKHKTNKQKT